MISSSFEISLLDAIEIRNLSEQKFISFLEMINPNLISSDLWNNICSRFVSKGGRSKQDKSQRYKIENISSNENYTNFVKGIISQLSEKCNGNVIEKNIVRVTVSSQFNNNNYNYKNIVELKNNDLYFSSNDKPDSWVQFDFKNIKIKPNGYSITSAPFESGFYHPTKWVIEGSDNGKTDWETLDSQNNRDLNGKNITKKYNFLFLLFSYN